MEERGGQSGQGGLEPVDGSHGQAPTGRVGEAEPLAYFAHGLDGESIGLAARVRRRLVERGAGRVELAVPSRDGADLAALDVLRDRGAPFGARREVFEQVGVVVSGLDRQRRDAEPPEQRVARASAAERLRT